MFTVALVFVILMLALMVIVLILPIKTIRRILGSGDANKTLEISMTPDMELYLAAVARKHELTVEELLLKFIEMGVDVTKSLQSGGQLVFVENGVETEVLFMEEPWE